MLRQLYYLILPYRSIAYPFLLLSAITVPCWLIVRLYHSRTSAHPASFGRELLLLIFVVYLSGLAAATLEPNHSRASVAATDGIELRPNLASLTCSSATGWRGSTARGFCMRNARGNVALFIPLGFLLPLVFRRLRFWSALLVAAALSISIELLQYLSRGWGVNRLADVNDVILNVAGACLGLLLVSMLRWRPGSRPAVARA
ncbi:MAG TPA: VanZ family protein [Gemmatimonadaceae bacterium]